MVRLMKPRRKRVWGRRLEFWACHLLLRVARWFTWTTSDQKKSWNIRLSRPNTKSNCHSPVPSHTHIRWPVPSMRSSRLWANSRQQHGREFVALRSIFPDRDVFFSGQARRGEGQPNEADHYI